MHVSFPFIIFGLHCKSSNVNYCDLWSSIFISNFNFLISSKLKSTVSHTLITPISIRGRFLTNDRCRTASGKGRRGKKWRMTEGRNPPLSSDWSRIEPRKYADLNFDVVLWCGQCCVMTLTYYWLCEHFVVGWISGFRFEICYASSIAIHRNKQFVSEHEDYGASLRSNGHHSASQ